MVTIMKNTMIMLNVCFAILAALFLFAVPISAQAVKEFSIEDAKISFEGGGSYPYTGKIQEPQIIVALEVDNEKIILEEGVHYTVTYPEDRNVGFHYVTVTGM